LRRAAAAAAAVALGLGARGGDDEEKQPAAGGGQTTPTTDRTAGEPSRDTTTGTTDTAPAQPTETAAPEDRPGGAGDEEPARSPADFTGRGGRIRPRTVLVPPYIAVTVSLRSADGGSYALRIGRTRLSSGQSATLDGLRPGAAYVGRGSDGGRLRIEASAEPGP
jgi:hypothetical protein